MGTAKVATATAVPICQLLALDKVLGRCAIFVHVKLMAKMPRLFALLILAIVRRHRPCELKRQHDHQEDGNPAAHDLEYIG